ncbi:sugar-binding transcriptional regulator [Halobacillus naozhouensis]|uniref:Sugar-binding transcriptional regulator n=1 Tax=Halobacillus naozhouensis TaxID=554880 RepID=A0ABY8J258_9BACI|nr:sugar-binding transcriptional regulator [Halobacillus naozhouensis]WFT75634.1 sugar-binding transcriptional regulator [Halobacillus naozhouensis]
MDWNEERRLIKVAKMYYKDQLTQSEIAKSLGIYRTTITRLLQKAREEGIVQVNIKGEYSEQVDLEDQLLKRFNIKEAVVIPSSPEQTERERKTDLGKAAVNFLNTTIRDGDTVGFAWGSTLGSMVDALERYKKREADFVPLVGGPGKMPVDHHVNTIVYNQAKAFGGQAHFIDSAAIVPSTQSKNEIFESAYFQDVLELWNKLTVAVVGIGTQLSSSNMIFSGFLGEEDYKSLESQGAIGDICSRFYDVKGKPVDGNVGDRTVAIELDRLKEIDYSIGVAESVEKTASIVGALRGNYITHLLTNDQTARSILEFVDDEEGGGLT